MTIICKICRLFLVGLLFLSVQHIDGKTMGFKYFKNYPYREYHSTPKNWTIAQDSRGVIYTANSYKILEYDGMSWQSIRVSSQFLFSLAIADDDSIFIGGNGDIGALTPDTKGFLQYTSLVNRLDNAYKNFQAISPTICVKDKTYFNDLNFLFQWDKKKEEMKVWKPEGVFKKAFNCGGRFFLYDEKTGMMELVNGALRALPGGSALAGKDIVMMADYDNNGKRFLVGSVKGGLYLNDGAKTAPFPTRADDYLIKNQLSGGIRLKSHPGEFAIATILGGLVIIDSTGEIDYIFNKETGLQDNHIQDVFEDFQGNVWMALSRGISMLEYSSPFEIYDDRLNLPGTPLSIQKHRGDLYVGTGSGLYKLSPSSTRGFQQVAGISDMCFSILFIEDSMLVATDNGILLVPPGQQGARRIIDTPSGFLYRTPNDSGRILAGTVQGLVSLRQDQKNNPLHWTQEKIIEETNLDIRSIVEDAQGNLWMGGLQEGVIKIDSLNNPHPPVITRYGDTHGLPCGFVSVYFAAGHVMFCTKEGIFRFDRTLNKFIPDKTLGNQLAGGGGSVSTIIEDRQKNMWVNYGENFLQAIAQPGGSYLIDNIPFLRIPPGGRGIAYPDPEDDRFVWLLNSEGLFRFDPAVKKNYSQDFTALIRSVQTIEGKDKFWGGNYHRTKNNPGPSDLTLEYRHRNLHITFAAPFFEDESRTVYRYILEGHDKAWSACTSQGFANYPDLAPGSYTFRVKAQNVYGHLSSEDSLRFKILPPWHRTWWAFLSYALGFFLALYFLVKWRSRKLQKENLLLEQIIRERTKEINDKNEQLEQYTDRLKEQSEQLREMDNVKSRFFANISHEFRTPLTLIIGPLEQIISNSRDSELQKDARLMLRNSERLLNLVNELLELAKFDSGKMKLQAARQDIIPFLRSMAASFESLLEQHKLELIFHSQEQEILLYFDTEKMEKITCNLIANAIKFTPSGGKISVFVKMNPEPDDHFTSGSVDITVADTGIGIPENQLPHVFDRFYRVEDSSEHKSKGAGIGLALTKELVDLHHGKVIVTSMSAADGEEKTTGTEFIVRLPLGKEYLKPEEIVETPDTWEQPLPQNGEEEPGIETVDLTVNEEETPGKNVILVVEDNADMRNYIRGALTPLYHVEEAVDGRDGMNKALEIIPDLIISDVMMPRADGFELCRQLKTNLRTSHIPIIILTAKVSEESTLKGLATGANDYIAKPFNTKILNARIKNLIDLRRQSQLKIIRRLALQPAEIPVMSIDEKFLNELQEMIEKNLADMEFGVEELSKKLFMGRTSVYRKIMALTGETPSQFIRSYRLQRATQLLRDRFGNVTEVAFAVGFSNTAYFTKCFREKFHRLPSTYQSSAEGTPAS